MPRPKLRTLFQHLHSQAQRTGRDQSADLFKGARIAVRVIAGETTLTVSRKDKPVGDVELVTFRNHCQVPESALRWPQEGQGTRELEGVTWHYVAWRWVAEEPPLDPYNLTIYVCHLCEEGGEFETAAAFKAHAVEAHQMTAQDVEAAVNVSHC